MIELPIESIITFNEDVTADSGESHAVLDRGGLEAAAARPWSGFDDVELYPTVFDKAGALLHALASRQIFENGNKRTAWIAAVAFLELNGVDIGSVSAIQADAFVRAAAVDHNFDAADVSEWFTEVVNAVRRGAAVDPRLEYALLAEAADHVDDGMVDLRVAHVHTAIFADFPQPAFLSLATRVHWRPDDLGRTHVMAASVEQAKRIVVPIRKDKWELVLRPPVVGGHPHHRDGIIPVIALMPLNFSVLRPGRVTVLLNLDGTEVARLPLRIADAADPLG